MQSEENQGTYLHNSGQTPQFYLQKIIEAKVFSLNYLDDYISASLCFIHVYRHSNVSSETATLKNMQIQNTFIYDTAT